MSLDVLDTGQTEDESEEMRARREAIIEASPPPQFFKLRAELLAQGRSNQTVADTGNMWVNLKVYASGGENGLHNHTTQDHFHLVLSGSARFYGPRGEEVNCAQHEGIMLPAGSFYRFHATSEEPLILLRVGAWTGNKGEEVSRFNVYGDPLPNHSAANGKIDVIPRKGEYWGAAE
jgi:mannose-6-phosphate isomerase-like protein (cupin superfamily)